MPGSLRTDTSSPRRMRMKAEPTNHATLGSALHLGPYHSTRNPGGWLCLQTPRPCLFFSRPHLQDWQGFQYQEPQDIKKLSSTATGFMCRGTGVRELNSKDSRFRKGAPPKPFSHLAVISSSLPPAISPRLTTSHVEDATRAPINCFPCLLRWRQGRGLK